MSVIGTGVGFPLSGKRSPVVTINLSDRLDSDQLKIQRRNCAESEFSLDVKALKLFRQFLAIHSDLIPKGYCETRFFQEFLKGVTHGSLWVRQASSMAAPEAAIRYTMDEADSKGERYDNIHLAPSIDELERMIAIGNLAGLGELEWIADIPAELLPFFYEVADVFRLQTYKALHYSDKGITHLSLEEKVNLFYRAFEEGWTLGVRENINDAQGIDPVAEGMIRTYPGFFWGC